MPPALVSVVIPCYRQAHFLAQAVEGVLRQTYTAHEIIVIDDGSPDEVAEVIRPYPVRYYRQEHRGPGAARNNGLEASVGEYLVFLDADDRLLPDALRVGAEALDAHPACAFVWGFNRPIDATGAPLPGGVPTFSGGASFAQLLRENVVGPPLGVMFRRSAVCAVGGFSTSLDCVADYELYLRLSQRFESFCHQQLIAEYRLHDANMSQDSEAMLRSMLAMLAQQRDAVKGRAALRQALASGERNARQQYDWEPGLARLRSAVQAKRWGEAIGRALTLLVKYPGRFTALLGRRVRRLAGLSQG